MIPMFLFFFALNIQSVVCVNDHFCTVTLSAPVTQETNVWLTLTDGTQVPVPVSVGANAVQFALPVDSAGFSSASL